MKKDLSKYLKNHSKIIRIIMGIIIISGTTIIPSCKKDNPKPDVQSSTAGGPGLPSGNTTNVPPKGTSSGTTFATTSGSTGNTNSNSSTSGTTMGNSTTL